VRIGSLFSGVGGLDLACERAFNATTIWQVEYDKPCQEVLAKHWPEIQRYGDVTEIDWETMEPVDILCGGYPCQPFSHAGKRKGTSDVRHLWPYFARAISHLRPRYAVLENVAGHLSLGFDRVLGDLAEIGYDCRWTTVRASDVGAPHRRERLFCLAYPAELGCERFGDSRFWRNGFANDDRPSTDPSSERHGRREEYRGLGGLDAEDAGITRQRERTREVAGYRGSLLPTPTARDWKDGSESNVQENALLGRVVWNEERWGRYGEAIARWEQVTGPAPEPTTGEKPRLNPDFVEWMMGYPKGWTFGTRTQRLRQLGNSVVPQQGEYAITQLLESAS
jgi:DNA (cytosine-5)-methyltransferase 1